MTSVSTDWALGSAFALQPAIRNEEPADYVSAPSANDLGTNGVPQEKRGRRETTRCIAPSAEMRCKCVPNRFASTCPEVDDRVCFCGGRRVGNPYGEWDVTGAQGRPDSMVGILWWESAGHTPEGLPMRRSKNRLEGNRVGVLPLEILVGTPSGKPVSSISCLESGPGSKTWALSRPSSGVLPRSRASLVAA